MNEPKKLTREIIEREKKESESKLPKGGIDAMIEALRDGQGYLWQIKHDLPDMSDLQLKQLISWCFAELEERTGESNE